MSAFALPGHWPASGSGTTPIGCISMGACASTGGVFDTYAVALTPEMRAYLDELQRRDDPKQNAIRAAMVKAEQRRARLASQAWYGYSNLRPIANPFPITSSYSPHWAGSYNDFIWYGSSTPLYFEQSIIYTR